MKPVNLIPQDQRRRVASEGGGNGATIALGVLAALLAMVVVYVLTSNTITERQDDSKAASAEADRLEAQASQEANYTDFAQIAQTRMQSVAGVAATRFDWERFMRELARIMPERSWIQTADASVTGDPTQTGPTTTAGATGVATSPTAKLVGCTPEQTDTATLMVRLGQLYRVSDVKLNESSVESVGGGTETETTVDECGNYYKYDVTVTFSPTPPATEVPRGATRVPASLGGGS